MKGVMFMGLKLLQTEVQIIQNYSLLLDSTLFWMVCQIEQLHSAQTASISEFFMLFVGCCKLFTFTNSVQTWRICLGDGVLHTQRFMLTIFLGNVGVLFRSGKY